MMLARATLLGVSLLAAACAASAQAARPFEISAYGGYRFGGEAFHATESTVTRAGRLEDGAAYGLRFGYLFQDRLEAELEWTAVDTNFRDSGPAPFPPTILPLRTDDILAGVAYSFSSAPLRPYVAAAAGVTRFGFEEGTAMGFQGGTAMRFTGRVSAGLKAFITPRLALRVEGGAYATHTGDDLFPCLTFPEGGGGDGVVPVSCAHDWVFQENVGAGLTFAF
jgi:hypothetical protein